MVLPSAAENEKESRSWSMESRKVFYENGFVSVALAKSHSVGGGETVASKDICRCIFGGGNEKTSVRLSTLGINLRHELAEFYES